MCWERRRQQHLGPLDLASLVSGPAGPLVGLFKSSSVAFQIGMGEYEAQKIATRSRGVYSLTLSRARANAPVPTR
jgi:hypothetical protein